jgi:LCP family protein required for cell wall assembly
MVRPGSPTPLWGAAGKAGYALSCVAAALVLAVSGFSYFVVRDVSSIGGSHAINSGPSIGAQNIFLMGLESRTDWSGNVLPNDILNALHAGSRQGVLYEGVGGNATNTLILIHIPAGGKKAIGFSIPRDDWVTFPETYDGQHTGKIDQAYGDALAEKESEVRQQHPNISQSQVAFQGNEAGRAATVATVESFTGVHIDHFAEINLDGFYELAKVLGGVTEFIHEDFEQLCEYLAGSPLTHLHVFPYSDRPGTEASSMSGKVAGTVIRERGRRVREIAQRLTHRFRDSQVGTTHRALTLEGGSLAVTGNYLKVRIPPGRIRNEWITVDVTRAGDPMVGVCRGSTGETSDVC